MATITMNGQNEVRYFLAYIKISSFVLAPRSRRFSQVLIACLDANSFSFLRRRATSCDFTMSSRNGQHFFDFLDAARDIRPPRQ